MWCNSHLQHLSDFAQGCITTEETVVGKYCGFQTLLVAVKKERKKKEEEEKKRERDRERVNGRVLREALE